ncbi:MAG: sulfotransferase domain-containing protein [Gammaproteobacteria bacterium]|nr:sulfotransferase domain-containing protein [Gammaproteobacteria bacterium]
MGTALFSRVSIRLAAHFGLSFQTVVGMAHGVDRSANIVVFAHSLLDMDLSQYDYRGIHLVRDPRDIWVSGYHYHRRTSEPWCINSDLDQTPPIGFPRVDYSQQHRPEAWKRAYLDGLNGRSYQQNLLNLDQRSGLKFELERYTAWTLEAIAAWEKRPDRILEFKLEAFADNFDGAMTTALSHLGFSGAALSQALALAANEDVARMDDTTIANHPHIMSRQLSKWRTLLHPDDVRDFEARHGDLIDRLGYERSVGQTTSVQ